MQEFFTWTMLATYAGGVAATAMLTQLLKELPFIKNLPTRVVSYIIAFVVLLVAEAFLTEITIERAVLCLINAAVIGFASNGAYDVTEKKKGGMSGE